MKDKKFNPQKLTELASYAQSKGIIIMCCEITDLKKASENTPPETVLAYTISKDMIDKCAARGVTEILLHLDEPHKTQFQEYQKAMMERMFRRIRFVHLAWNVGVISFLFLSGLLTGLYIGG